jgi:hypothetical protein
MKFMRRIPNFCDMGDKKPPVYKFNVFAQFVKMITKDNNEKVLLQFSKHEGRVHDLLYKKGNYFLRFRDLNNPWCNGWISGTNSEITRFLEEAKRKIIVTNPLKLTKGLKVFLEDQEILGFVEYVSEKEPYAFILIEDETGKSIGFQGLDEIIHREISKNIL